MDTRTLLCAASALVCVCAATAAASTQTPSDATLEGVKITVDRHGTLTLSGQASSRAAAERTIEIARRSDGVKSVRSLLTVARRGDR